MERPNQQEQIKTPEKSAEGLYLDALEKKRDTLLAFHTMNSFRKSKTFEEMASEELEQYKVLREDWRTKKESSFSSSEGLSKDKQEELAAMGSRLYDVQAKLTLLGLKETPESQVAETAVPKEPKEKSHKQAVTEKPESGLTLADVEDKIARLKKSSPTPLLELAAWEFKKAELEERQSAEVNPDQTTPKGFLVRVKKVFSHANAIAGNQETVESRMSPLGLRKEAVESLVPETTDKTPETTPEIQGSKQWTVLGWLAERGKGILSAGIWEVRQAWRFQRGTKFAANDLEALSSLVQVEDKSEGDKIFNELQNLMKENNITTVTAPEFLDIAKKVTSEKAAENNDRTERIIKNAVDTLKEKVVKYRGQATAETVLTPENLKAVENELRMQLNKFRDGATMQDVKNFTRVMRDNMDKRWWLRYVYAPLEASLLGYLGYHYLPWSRWFSGGDIVPVPGGEDVNLPAEDFGQRYMDHNMWEESREHLKELGIDNPTNQEIQAVDSAAAQENNIRVVNPETNQTLWPETGGGQTKDIGMVKGLIKWGAAHKVALGIKVARLGLKAATGF